jgi:protein EFR3
LFFRAVRLTILLFCREVQVTLQILAALIEKSPRDLPLYAPYVLKIFHLILHSGDITMVESSLLTFEAFCEHHDVATLSADQQYLRQYEEIVRTYAGLASTRPKPTKVAPTAPVAMRWRVVGLQAVKSVASSEALASVAGRQLDVIMPMLLENLWTDSTEYLELLLQRAQLEEKVDVEKMLRRRTSIATVRTVETSDTNPAALSGTTADADKLAEEDIGVLAIQCLKQIFVVNNRSQIHGATISMIKFVAERVAQGELVINTNPVTSEDRGWATTIFLMVARWAPVQDRHVILLTTLETLVRCPLTEANLPLHLVLTIMIGSLLRSEINLIGLSVMDVLLGLIKHILRILQLGGSEPIPQQASSAGAGKTSKASSKEPSPSTSAVGHPIVEAATSPSIPRLELLARLQQCVGDLATHVYYADQISDMISAILFRLKPSPLSWTMATAEAIENPEATANVLTAAANLVEDPNTDGFFSIDTAKITALNAIKSILLVATQKKLSGGASLGRNRCGIRVWEGTQWLLRDPDGRVRKAYIDALLTWLEREMTKADLRAFEDKSTTQATHKSLVRNGGDDSVASLTKRAVSNASPREKPTKPSKTTFLQLLHLAVYENALQYIDSEADVLLLHLLLVDLVDKLGVNAVKSGLPMIFRLQEDIQDAETMAKVRMGSICHGYFWALSEKFDFDGSGIGREIHQEIARRRSKGFWIDMIRLPPVRLDQIGDPGAVSAHQGLPMDEIESESLKPFDNRSAMVELISIAYSENMGSPPNSPSTSPGRTFNQPILSGTSDPVSSEHKLPAKIKEEMLSEWSRESVIAGAQESSKTVSLNGSRAGTGSGRHPRNFLTVNGDHKNGGTNSGTQSPKSATHHHHPRPSSQAYGLVGGIGAIQKFPKSSAQGGSALAASDSSRNSVTRVDQLKRVLSGQAPPSRGLGVAHSDASSESMISYEGPASELSYDNRGTASNDSPRRLSAEPPRSKSRDRVLGSGEHLSPLSSNPVIPRQEIITPAVEEEDENADTIPPVPPLPATLPIPGGFPGDGSQDRIPTPGISTQENGNEDPLRIGRRPDRELKSRGGQSYRGAEWEGDTGPVLDLEALLKGIGTGENKKGTVNIGTPPY